MIQRSHLKRCVVFKHQVKHPLLPWIARLRLTPNPFCLLVTTSTSSMSISQMRWILTSRDRLSGRGHSCSQSLETFELSHPSPRVLRPARPVFSNHLGYILRDTWVSPPKKVSVQMWIMETSSARNFGLILLTMGSHWALLGSHINELIEVTLLKQCMALNTCYYLNFCCC